MLKVMMVMLLLLSILLAMPREYVLDDIGP